MNKIGGIALREVAKILVRGDIQQKFTQRWHLKYFLKNLYKSAQ